MKKTHKLFLLCFMLIGALFQSCETTELELVNNPNNLTSGDAQFLLNNIQTSYRGTQTLFNDRSSELTRIDYMFGIVYFANYGAASMNNPWGTLYSTIIPDIQAIEAAKTEDNSLAHHLGMAKIMQAHIMMQLVDFIGDIVPLDEAGNPAQFPTPNLTTDGGASAYASALNLLDEAIALLNEGASIDGVTDLFYGGDAGDESDPAKWIKLANTLKMRAALTTDDLTTFNSIASNDDNFISSSADDFQFNFGTQLAPVNTQHQDYQADYTSAGANIYQSNWLMDLMNNSNDPRIRYYFYRQNNCTPGATCNLAGNGEQLQCSLQTVFPHLVGTPSADIWCFLENGYWGRIHGNDRGTPPDNFFRTAVGVYPAGGLFDDDSFGNVDLGEGGNGAGIEPIILASYVDFWRAEAALAGGSAPAASGFIAAGLEKSIDKVQGFGDLDGGADMSFAPSSADVTAFIDGVVSDFDDATGADQWNILAEQYFVTMFGGGADAHNFYRRTGFPTTVSLNFGSVPGNYPRTFLFPASEVGANPNVSQRTDNNSAVFWNTQPLPVQN